MLEAVVNVSEGRRSREIEHLGDACGPALLDVHSDADHDRTVFTLVGGSPADTEAAVRRLADAVAAGPFDLRESGGVHPRLGVLDVVPFVALDEEAVVAVRAARAFATWLVGSHGVPVFLYDDADPRRRTLPDARRDAFVARTPDLGPARPHPRLGATAVGARPPMIAVNCELDSDDLALAKRLARAVRERDGGVVGVRALGLPLATTGRAQVSMNLVDLRATGLEAACTMVRDLARAEGADVARVEIVGLIPARELERLSTGFSAWSGVSDAHTIEAATARVGAGGGAPAGGSSATAGSPGS